MPSTAIVVPMSRISVAGSRVALATAGDAIRTLHFEPIAINHEAPAWRLASSCKHVGGIGGRAALRQRPKLETVVLRKCQLQGLIVSESVRLIVNAYVQLRDRQAIEELREHRQMLREKLQANRQGRF